MLESHPHSWQCNLLPVSIYFTSAKRNIQKMIRCVLKCHSWPPATSSNEKVKIVQSNFYSAKCKQKKSLSMQTFMKCLSYAMCCFRCYEEYNMNYGSLPSHRLSDLKVCHLHCCWAHNAIIFFIFRIICSPVIACDSIASLRHLYKLLQGTFLSSFFHFSSDNIWLFMPTCLVFISCEPPCLLYYYTEFVMRNKNTESFRGKTM